MPVISVAGINIELCVPQWMISKPLYDFEISDTGRTIKIEAQFGPLPAIQAGSLICVQVPGRTIYEYDGFLHFNYTPDDGLSYMRVASDYSFCQLGIETDHNQPDDPDIRSIMADKVLYAVREILTGRLIFENGLRLHSSVVLSRGFGILFSAVSGTGKSTHAHLWNELLPDVRIINGDNGFCRLSDDTPVVYGAPWCGSSGEYINTSAPVRAIVFLEQATENKIVKLGTAEAFMRLSARCYMPVWDKHLMEKCIETTEKFVRKVDCWLLSCLPDYDAVRVVNQCIWE